MNQNSKKTILQVLPALNDGGVERGVYDICSFAVKTGFEYEIQVASSGGKFVDKLRQKNIKHHKLNLKTKNPIKIILNAFRLANVCKENNVGVIHARSRAPAWSAFIASKIVGVPYITTFHGFYKFQNIFKKFYNSVMVYGDKIIAVSHFVKNHILTFYNVSEEKIITIHRGVDLDFFNPEKILADEIAHLKDKLGITNQKIILLVGRVTHWKGQDIAIKAMKKVNSDAVLVLVGDVKSSSQKYYENLKRIVVENSLENKVIFAGSSDNLPLYYKACDVALNTSREAETFGRVTAEAGAFGKPVIATDIGGSLEIIKEGKTGYLVPIENPEILANKIDEVLVIFTDKNFAEEFSKNTIERIHRKFSLKQMCEKNFDLYRGIISNSH
ncbi:MAG: glycosyltransferase family 4 protein [Rickettsiales bacterium]|nr:glycosyltransferase family 4 protein [Rickettsiales bacterium]